MGVGKLGEIPDPRLLPRMKSGTSWMPSGCTHPPSCTLGQKPALDFASLCVDLLSHSPNLNQTKCFCFTDNFQANGDIDTAKKVVFLRAGKRPRAESTCILESFSGCFLRN